MYIEFSSEFRKTVISNFCIKFMTKNAVFLVQQELNVVG